MNGMQSKLYLGSAGTNPWLFSFRFSPTSCLNSRDFEIGPDLWWVKCNDLDQICDSSLAVARMENNGNYFIKIKILSSPYPVPVACRKRKISRHQKRRGLSVLRVREVEKKHNPCCLVKVWCQLPLSSLLSEQNQEQNKLKRETE